MTKQELIDAIRKILKEESSDSFEFYDELYHLLARAEQ
jgi:hypothetical protein